MIADTDHMTAPVSQSGKAASSFCPRGQVCVPEGTRWIRRQEVAGFFLYLMKGYAECNFYFVGFCWVSLVWRTRPILSAPEM
jgi:hypothetical protein